MNGSSCRWRKSTRSNNGGNCVEVAAGGHVLNGVLVRDTTDRDGGALVASSREWAAFLAGARAGRYDLP